MLYFAGVELGVLEEAVLAALLVDDESDDPLLVFAADALSPELLLLSDAPLSPELLADALPSDESLFALLLEP